MANFNRVNNQKEKEKKTYPSVVTLGNLYTETEVKFWVDPCNGQIEYPSDGEYDLTDVDAAEGPEEDDGKDRIATWFQLYDIADFVYLPKGGSANIGICSEDPFMADDFEDFSKYWSDRFILFSKYEAGIKMDTEGWYSATPECIAEHQASRCGTGVVLDCFTGVGGNAIRFAKISTRVIAIDIDPTKIEYAKCNAEIYGVKEKILFLTGDCYNLAKNYKADTVFLSPPWGGLEYAREKIFDLNKLKPYDGKTLFDMAIQIANRIVMFLPRTVDLGQLADLSLSASPTWTLEVEHNYVNGRWKAITAYFTHPSLSGKKNQSQKSSSVFEDVVDDAKLHLLADCLLASAKVLMNLPNDNPVGCRQIAACGGLETLCSLIAGHYPSFSSHSPNFSDQGDKSIVLEGINKRLNDQELEFHVAIVGLLVNLVEKDGRDRSRLAEIWSYCRSRLAAAGISIPSSSGLDFEITNVIPLLCSIFMANQGAGEAAEEKWQAIWVQKLEEMVKQLQEDNAQMRQRELEMQVQVQRQVESQLQEHMRQRELELNAREEEREREWQQKMDDINSMLKRISDPHPPSIV